MICLCGLKVFQSRSGLGSGQVESASLYFQSDGLNLSSTLVLLLQNITVELLFWAQWEEGPHWCRGPDPRGKHPKTTFGPQRLSGLRIHGVRHFSWRVSSNFIFTQTCFGKWLYFFVETSRISVPAASFFPSAFRSFELLPLWIFSQ